MIAWPLSTRSTPTVGVVAITASVCAFVAGSLLATTGEPANFALAAIVGGATLAFAIASPRWAAIVLVAVLVSYAVDLTPGVDHVAASGLVLIVLVGAVTRRRIDHEPLTFPRVGGWLIAYAVSLALLTLPAAEQSAAFRQLIDFVGFAALVLVLVALMDSPVWLHRLLWAVVGPIAALAALAVFQQLTRTYQLDFGGFVRVENDADLVRSAGPLSANYFGQVLVVASVLAGYLAFAARSTRERVSAGIAVTLSVVALLYTYSRGAVLALLVAGLLCLLLRRVRGRVLFAAGAVIVGAWVFVVPGAVTARVTELTALTSPAHEQDSSLRGRVGENLAAYEMWRAHPILGVGPGNFETNYLKYSPQIGLDARTEGRSAHSLYLESLAETGLLGTLPFFGILGLALWIPWRARRRSQNANQLLAEGAFVAVCAFLVSAVALHAAYPRFMWILIGIAYATRCLAPDST